MDFVRDLVKAGSVEFDETSLEHVGLLFVAKKAGVQRFILDARASKRHFLIPPAGPLLTGERLCHVEFQGSLEDAQNWFVVRLISNMRSIRCASLDACRRFLHCPLSSHPKLLTRGKRSMEEDFYPIPGFILFLQHTQ